MLYSSVVIWHRAELIFFSSGCRSWKLRLYFHYGSWLLSVIQAAGSGIMVWAIFTWHHLIIIYEIWVAFIHLRVKHGFILYLYILPLFVTKQYSSLLLYNSVMVSLWLIKFNVNKLTQIITGSVNFKGQFSSRAAFNIPDLPDCCGLFGTCRWTNMWMVAQVTGWLLNGQRDG